MMIGGTMNLEQVGNALLSLDGDAGRVVLDAVDELQRLREVIGRIRSESLAPAPTKRLMNIFHMTTEALRGENSDG